MLTPLKAIESLFVVPKRGDELPLELQDFEIQPGMVVALDSDRLDNHPKYGLNNRYAVVKFATCEWGIDDTEWFYVTNLPDERGFAEYVTRDEFKVLFASIEAMGVLF